MNLAVNEFFGPTFQGEGRNIGTPCVFLRLAGCNLACSWCDTPYAWDWSRYDSHVEIKRMTIDEVVTTLSAMPVKHLVITGGEPMLQKDAIAILTRTLHKWYVEIETAGTIAPKSSEIANLFTVSPKLKSSGNGEKRYNPDVLMWFRDSGRAVFKFVVTDFSDFGEIDEMVVRLKLHPVYIMPEGVTANKVTQSLAAIAPHVVARGYYLTTRLQVEAYGNRRGV